MTTIRRTPRPPVLMAEPNPCLRYRWQTTCPSGGAHCCDRPADHRGRCRCTCGASTAGPDQVPDLTTEDVVEYRARSAE